MQTMLTDKALGEKLAAKAETDKGFKATVKKLFTAIRSFLSELSDFFKANPVGNSTIRRNIEALSDSFEKQAEFYFGALETASRNRAAAITQEMSAETENTADDGGVRKQIRENIIDINGKVYDKVIELSYKQFRKVSRSNRALMDFIRENLAGEKMTVHNKDGSSETVEFARANERVSKNGSSERKVLGELAYGKSDIEKLVVMNAKETAEISEFKENTSEHSHAWLDENGWEIRTSYVITKDGIIYPVNLSIAKARDGRNILYSAHVQMENGVPAEKMRTSQKKDSAQHIRTRTPSTDSISDSDGNVKTQNAEKRSQAREAASSVENDPRMYGLVKGETGEYGNGGFITPDGEILYLENENATHSSVEETLADYGESVYFGADDEVSPEDGCPTLRDAGWSQYKYEEKYLLINELTQRNLPAIKDYLEHWFIDLRKDKLLVMYGDDYFEDFERSPSVADDIIESISQRAVISRNANPKIRRQAREIETAYDKMGETERLAAENEKLRDDIDELNRLVAALKQDKTLTNGTVATKSSVSIAASWLLDRAGVVHQGNKNELMSLLQEYFSFITQGEDLAWEDVMGEAQGIASWLVDRIKPERDTTYEDAKKAIRAYRIIISKISAQEKTPYRYFLKQIAVRPRSGQK